MLQTTFGDGDDNDGVGVGIGGEWDIMRRGMGGRKEVEGGTTTD